MKIHICSECGKEFKSYTWFRKHLRSHEQEQRISKRKELGHICGTCWYFGANAPFKKIGGRDIISNECCQGQKSVKSPPRIVSAESGCIFIMDLWLEK